MDTNLRTFSYNGRDYILQLWDIAGKLSSVIEAYY